MSIETPKDEEIVACLLGYPWLNSYVVKNKLRAKYKGITTPAVLRRLKKLEAAGHVVRVPTPYATMIGWTIAPLKQEQS